MSVLISESLLQLFGFMLLSHHLAMLQTKSVYIVQVHVFRANPQLGTHSTQSTLERPSQYKHCKEEQLRSACEEVRGGKLLLR